MALYHKYRPQTFQDIIDQEHIVQTLTNQILNDKVSHAYLFSGPRGVGKTTTARILAKSLNCANRKPSSAEPCNNCSSCEEISTSSSIDVIEIDAASHTGVDNVRQNIIENSQFKPTHSKYKVFIIDEVHMLSTAAFNALLKTLEEPPKYVVFILATTDPQKLPATIISRCQRYTFTKVPPTKMKKSLENIAKKEDVKIDDEVLLRIARKSEGCLRDGISLLEQLLASGDKKITAESASLILPSTNIELQLEFIQYLADKKQVESLNFLDKLTREGLNISYFSHEFIEFLRILMISSVDMSLAEQELDINKEQKQQITEINAKISETGIITLLDLAIRRDSEIKNSVLPQLPLEMLVIEWCNKDNSSKQETTSTIIPQTKIENKILNTIIETKVDETVKETQVDLPDTDIITKTEKIEEIKIISNENNTNEITLTQVENIWSEFIKKIESEAPSLTFVLKMSKINEIKNNVITISVEYSFHKEKLQENTTKQKLESVLKDLLKTKIILEIIENKNGQTNVTQNNNPLNDLATALGGEIIS
ncbi:MAG: DNA polymerase III subunit gamma/tau [Candidatus Magasanikbacteria bacterium]